MESKELSVGDTATYDIAGKKVVLKPVTLGKMKRAVEAFKRKDGDTFEMMQEHLFEVLANGENSFATKEWINNSITMPMATRIITDMRIINGLERADFFQAGSPTKEVRDLSGSATPSA